jgi:hypothetical protein
MPLLFLPKALGLSLSRPNRGMERNSLLSLLSLLKQTTLVAQAVA